MKILTVVALLAVGAYSKVISPPEVIISPEETTAYNYHEKFGIAEAERVRLAEEQLLSDPSRIAGGVPIGSGSYLCLGGLVITLTNDLTSICGSALLSNTRLMTAAHCWWDGRNQASQFVVVLGSITLSTGGVRRTTRNVNMHPDWDPWNIRHDIAIISISHVAYTNNIDRFPLPYNLANQFVGTWGFVAGWGLNNDTSSFTLDQVRHRIEIRIIPNEECRQFYGDLVTDEVLCTSPIGPGGVRMSPCAGDSGGPIVFARMLLGVVSFGANDGCPSSYPTVYTRSTSYVDFVHWHL